MNHFTETTTTSYGENIGSSFKGILFGIILIIGSIILLSYNENRSINQTLALEEMQSKIITLQSTKYDTKYENNPILIQGEVTPIKELEDSQFGVKSDGLVLERRVEMYQWRENKTTKSEDKMGGSTETTTTYDYAKEWSSTSIDSSSFKHPENHQNPPMAYSRATYTTDANIGDFYLSKNIINHFSTGSSFDGLSSMPDKIGDMKNYKSYLYKGKNPNTPAIGDIKITYTQAPKGTYSLAGMVKKKALVPYISQNDRTLLFVRNGIVSADKIFQEEFDSNSMLTWGLRAIGLLLMFFGFKLIMGPLATLANVIPMFGSLIGGASSIVAGVLTLLLGSIVIAIAWFASRPILSLIIIAVGIGLTVILNRFKKDKGSFGQNSQTTPPPRRR
ncbi:hypothetical protein MNB_SV-12-1118 [hydrothermal vent metagenome]|uniref:Uncharacterized protein n=1 Tax=hydrothermal vent metagenome TaxID=652676 RepID=A0A1W1BBN8_9ZZZZ